jgi:hypothetical protein
MFQIKIRINNMEDLSFYPSIKFIKDLRCTYTREVPLRLLSLEIKEEVKTCLLPRNWKNTTTEFTSFYVMREGFARGPFLGN